MRMCLLFLALSILLNACSGKRKAPDVSGIKTPLTVQRFDEDLFNIDTNTIQPALNALQNKYGAFVNDYLYNILAAPPVPDSAVNKLKMFIHDYKPVYDTSQLKFKSFDTYRKETEKALQFTKYYFPDYKVPTNLITFIGPLEGYANVLTSSGLAVGLQLYLGKNYPVYHSEYISEVYPEYQSRRFEPQYIPVNCIKNVIEDIYPSSQPEMPMIYQMIEAGKRLYILDQLMPFTADSLKTGYTQSQLEGCYDHEAMIWNFFIENNLLYATDPSVTRDYMDEGPKTDILGEGSPGFIGQFVGWQIVKKWMQIHEAATLTQLLETPAKQIFEEAKYKPR